MATARITRDEEIRNATARRRNLLFLMQRYLIDAGLFNAAEALKVEARLSDEYELCDNIDLDHIYLEYASYYHLKFGKYPHMLRKAKAPVKLEIKQGGTKKPTSPKLGNLTSSKGQAETPPGEPQCPASNPLLQLSVTKIDVGSNEKPEKGCESFMRMKEIEHINSGLVEQMLGCQDWQALVDLVRLTILRDDIKLNWSDMCGNGEAIDIIKEAVLVPINHPQLFLHGLKPWRSVLLHGPPGSGKTLLAKILYAETRSQVTFFNVTSSILVSKWRGESEKLLRILFFLAQKHAPSVIFFDEIEGLTSKRDRVTDHESSKRFKNELLQLLDGMEQHTSGIFVLASTNLPWDIDEAFLRRFEKKLLVQLPNAIERARLISRLLPLTLSLNKEDMTKLVRLSEHFTGDEIRLACKEIAMQSVRRVTRGREAAEVSIEEAFGKIKPLGLKLMNKHQDWQKDHGS